MTKARNGFLALFFMKIPHKVIINCEGEKYLTRYYLVRTRWLSVFLHIFHCSDEDRALHDHPWNYVTFLLWRGYYEHTPKGVFRRWPLTFAFHPARWRHRVELVDGKPAVTLFIHFKRLRSWGYHLSTGWKRHDVWWKENCE